MRRGDEMRIVFHQHFFTAEMLRQPLVCSSAIILSAAVGKECIDMLDEQVGGRPPMKTDKMNV